VVNLIDKFVGYLDPDRGLKRHFRRQQLQRAYEAASPRDLWRPRRAGASSDADHAADASTIRAKARALVQNVPYIEAGLEGLVSATIGTGITPRATGGQAKVINEAFTAWSKVCDADGRLDYYGLQAAAYRAMEQDGEVLVRLRPRRPSDNLPVPLQLQLLEIDWLDSTRTQASAGNQIINGIEYDPLGAVAAYWLWDSHPGDINVFTRARMQSRRIEAANIIHLFTTKRPSQGRGFSRLAPVIVRARDLQLYEDAEQARKNLESRLGVLVSGDATVYQNPAANGEPISSATIQTTGQLGELPSGGMTQVPAGSSITAVEPKPAGGYVEYVKLNLHLIAAGMGVPYEMLTGDVSEVNFSSARVRLLDFRRAVDQTRWLVLIPGLLDRIHRAFIDAGVLAGKFRQVDYAVDYSTPKWDYVNPAQDVGADIAEISVGLASVSEKLRMRGYKPEDVAAEIAKDFELFKGLGIMDILLFKEKGRAMAGDAPPAAPSADQGKRFDAIERLLERLDTQVCAIATRTPTINVQNGPRNELRADAPVINLPQQAAPIVNVTAQAAAPEVRIVNEVQPAKVTLHIPPRKTVSEVRRDAQGRAAGVIQTETDA
jgi:lambda family phage portal protein